ncbi:MAG: T9SS type A sorting domain-containing protein [Bacteroidetes bacterium]|nr:T9SS type A sorting domain-containing protein [Bacteroidota bacterium]
MKILLSILLTLYIGLAFAQSDTPCNSPFLMVNPVTCGFSLGSTFGLNYQFDTANGGVPTCGFAGSPDGWYRVVVPASGAIAITAEAASITDASLSVYHGPCNNLQLIECDDDDGVDMMPVVDRSDYTPGDTLYVRIWNSGGTIGGTFNICAVESHSDCRSATFICGEQHLSSNAYGAGSNLDAFGANCIPYEYQSYWLWFVIKTAGFLKFAIYPDTLATGIYPDYDWMMWQDTLGFSFCSSFTNSLPALVCNATSSMGLSGETGLDATGTSYNVPPGPGNPFCPLLMVLPGERYFLFINNFTTSSTGFRISFAGSTSTLDCNPLVTGVQELLTQPLSLKIFPNPLSGQGVISFYLPENEKVSLKIYDHCGQLLHILADGVLYCKGQHELPVNSSSLDLTAGVYFLEIQTPSGQLTRKIFRL